MTAMITKLVLTPLFKKKYAFPTDAKLHIKIIKKCLVIAKKEQLSVRQTYTRTLKKLGVDQRFRNHVKNKSKARKAIKRLVLLQVDWFVN